MVNHRRPIKRYVKSFPAALSFLAKYQYNDQAARDILKSDQPLIMF